MSERLTIRELLKSNRALNRIIDGKNNELKELYSRLKKFNFWRRLFGLKEF